MNKLTETDLLKNGRISIDDRMDSVLKLSVLDGRILRLFAAWCARQALTLLPDRDKRSIKACEVAERYANGDANEDDLRIAWIAACAAARPFESDRPAFTAIRTVLSNSEDAAILAYRDAKKSGVNPEKMILHLIEMLEYEDSSQNRR